MQTLVIGSEALKEAVEESITNKNELVWANGMGGAYSQLEAIDIDAVIYDSRDTEEQFSPDLKSLIASIPVTTRVLAIVKQLPEEEIFVESGVIYLTPPVNIDDIRWFIRSEPRLIL